MQRTGGEQGIRLLPKPMKWVRIAEAPADLRGEIHLPSSKSVSNRVLIIRALSGVDFPIYNLSVADDTILLRQILTEPENELYLNTENAGTVMRFLTAYFASSPDKDIILTGDERMYRRPIGSLVNALRSMGAEIEYREKTGYPPLHITGKRLNGGYVSLDVSESSQFATALLLIAPTLVNGLTIELKGQVASESYLNMTLHILSEFGIGHDRQGNTITISRQLYLTKAYFVESDWSAAGYWYGLASLVPESDIHLPHLYENSCQGDSLIASIAKDYFDVNIRFENKGLTISGCPVKSKVEKLQLDMLSHPDLIPTIVTLCCLHKISFRIKGTSTLKLKESDRAQALKTELAKLNCELRLEENALESVTFGETPNHLINLNTYSDHRLAMCWAMMAARYPNVWIENPGCTDKSYPHFWEDLEKCGFILQYEKRN
jgi:3-phosphoshikimate 1-carboxyvinyltransferase